MPGAHLRILVMKRSHPRGENEKRIYSSQRVRSEAPLAVLEWPLNQQASPPRRVFKGCAVVPARWFILCIDL